MRRTGGVLAILLLLAGASCARAPIRRSDSAPRRGTAQTEPRTEPLDDLDRRMNDDHELSMREREAMQDLWYGTPGVRAGGDLIGSIFRLITDPSQLLNFDPRGRPSGPPALDGNMQRALNEMLRRYDRDR